MIDLAACYFHKSTYESITFFSIFLTTFLRRESKKGERGFFFRIFSKNIRKSFNAFFNMCSRSSNRYQRPYNTAVEGNLPRRLSCE